MKEHSSRNLLLQRLIYLKQLRSISVFWPNYCLKGFCCGRALEAIERSGKYICLNRDHRCINIVSSL